MLQSGYHLLSVFLQCEFIQRSIICRFGIPNPITSDNGKHLNNKSFQEFCFGLEIVNKFSSPAHSQSNNQVNAVNKIIKGIMRKSCSPIGRELRQTSCKVYHRPIKLLKILLQKKHLSLLPSGQTQLSPLRLGFLLIEQLISIRRGISLLLLPT